MTFVSDNYVFQVTYFRLTGDMITGDHLENNGKPNGKAN